MQLPTTLTGPAARTAALLSARSKSGLEHDPIVEMDDLLSELEIDHATLEASVADLLQYQLVASRLHALWPLAPLFWWADPAVHGWNPVEDATAVAIALIQMGQASSYADVRLLAEQLDWVPRRINPAVAYLIQNDKARSIRELGGGLYGGYSLLATGATRLLAAATVPAPAGGLRIVMFTDVVGSTALLQAFGDEVGRAILGRHDQIVRVAVQATGGRIVKGTGDGFFVVFSSLRAALDTALSIRESLAKAGQQYPDQPVAVRIGIDAGELVADGEDLFGMPVNRASRIVASAAADQILVSAVIVGMAGEYSFATVGTRVLKDIGEVALYELRGKG